MENEITEITQVEMLTAINRAEVDIQIATAKQYPRVLSNVLHQIETYAMMDVETAECCHYQLKRKDESGGDKIIEGVSVRMAEIIASAWGNLRIQTRIIRNDGKMIIAQGICHDLETNVAVSKEVNRSITTKYGKPFSTDMQVVTGNAASSIAFRNAVLAVIPKAITQNILKKVKEVAISKIVDIEEAKRIMFKYYARVGVTPQQIFEYLEIKDETEISCEQIMELRALKNAIKEGTITVAETFGKKEETPEEKKAEMKTKPQNPIDLP